MSVISNDSNEYTLGSASGKRDWVPATSLALGYAGLLAAAHLACLAALFRASGPPTSDFSLAMNVAGQAWMVAQVAMLTWCLVSWGLPARWVAVALLVWCGALSAAQPYFGCEDCLLILLCVATLVAGAQGLPRRSTAQGRRRHQRGNYQFTLLHLMLALTLLSLASAVWTQGWLPLLPEGLASLVRSAATGGVLGIACLLGGGYVLRSGNLTSGRRLLALACCAAITLGLGAAVEMLGTLPSAVIWAAALALAGTAAVARYLPELGGEAARLSSR